MQPSCRDFRHTWVSAEKLVDILRAVRASEETQTLDPKDAAQSAVEAAVDKLASDVVLLDVREQTDYTDFVMVCTADSERQIRAVSEAIETAMKPALTIRRRVEGDPDSGWIVQDYGDVVVHVFAPAEREYYRLERIWRDAPTVVAIP